MAVSSALAGFLAYTVALGLCRLVLLQLQGSFLAVAHFVAFVTFVVVVIKRGKLQKAVVVVAVAVVAVLGAYVALVVRVKATAKRFRNWLQRVFALALHKPP